MADGKKGDFMPKVDLSKDHKFINQSQLDYMRILQQRNAGEWSQIVLLPYLRSRLYNVVISSIVPAERVKRLQILRKRNYITAGVLGVGVAAIFGYSLWSVGNEKFLEEPEKK